MMSNVRVMFDELTGRFPISASRLDSNSKIVHNKSFKSAIVKLQEQKVCELSAAEMAAVKTIKCSTIEFNHEEVSGLTFDERLLKRRKLEATSNEYMDTRFLLPTSIICERLFSKAGFALNDRRKQTSPIHFEQQMFLHADSHLWSIADVHNLFK